jgi:hypothetical protein
MTIKVVKNASSKKPAGYCETWIDEPALNKK